MHCETLAGGGQHAGKRWVFEVHGENHDGDGNHLQTTMEYASFHEQVKESLVKVDKVRTLEFVKKCSQAVARRLNLE